MVDRPQEFSGGHEAADGLSAAALKKLKKQQKKQQEKEQELKKSVNKVVGIALRLTFGCFLFSFLFI